MSSTGGKKASALLFFLLIVMVEEKERRRLGDRQDLVDRRLRDHPPQPIRLVLLELKLAAVVII